MAQRYDISLKALFQSEGDGILRRRLLGGKAVEYLATEQPQVFNRHADLVARTEGGSVRHCEFQSSNEDGFAVRMLGYYAYLVAVHGQHVAQTVLYVGREPLRLESSYNSPSIDFRFEIVNLREFEAGPLLESADWADNVLALLAKGEPLAALAVVVDKLRGMEGEERDRAAATVLLLSGILEMEHTVRERLKEVGMINVMENKVLGPMMQEQFALGKLEGQLEGKIEGKLEGSLNLLQELLVDKFGALPLWATQRLEAATGDELHAWAKRVLRSTTLEEALR